MKRLIFSKGENLPIANSKTVFQREIIFCEIKKTKIQSVGKFDKQMKPIFEGHIIREFDNGEHCDFLIYYDVSECAFMAYLIDSEDYSSYHLSSFDQNEIEIVGHYLTDKNLLKNFDISRIKKDARGVLKNN